MLSADELLKSHSIPELRLLQDKLHNEANGKKQELQSMVGSKYHDFIQSADAITIMRDKSELMGEKLALFQKCSMALVIATNELLSGGKGEGEGSSAQQQQQEQQQQQNNLNTMATPSPNLIWSMLERCDIFNAGLNVQLSRMLLGDFGSGAGCYVNRPDTMLNLDFVLESPTLAKQCSSCVFLRQTVVDDAKLLLHLPDLSATEQAQTLATLGLVGGVRRAELLSSFFESAKLMLMDDANVNDFASTSTSDEADLVMDLDLEMDLGEQVDKDLGSQAKNLLKSVKMLQKTILDAHALFFKTWSGPAAGNPTAQVREWITLLKPAGLLAVHQLVFMDELISRFRDSIPCSSSSSSSSSAAAASVQVLFDRNGVTFDKASFDANELRATGQAELKRVFDKWLGEAVRRVSDRSRKVLGAMQSAAQVARLQQLVYHCSTTIVAGAGGGGGGSSYTMENWLAACFDLLASPRLRARIEKEREAGAVLSAADDPTKLLWSTALRAPFMMQVERLLRTSCQAVVTRARERLLLALESEGLTIDSFTLQVKLPASATPLSGGPTASSSSFSMGANASHSARLFRRAETVRAQLEDDLLELVRDIVRSPAANANANANINGTSGGGVNDPQSSAALQRAFYVQCSQLLGQIVVALRCLGSNLAAALARPQAQLQTTAANVYPHPTMLTQQLQCGLLFVARVAWLLRMRGRFLEEALAPPTVATAATQTASAIDHNHSSEDQLRSAFEIADTDGDGIVTYSEAVEAVQALAVGDPDELGGSTSTSSPQTPFLSMLLTPSLTFGEMAMVCAHLLQPDVCRPVQRLRQSLDELATAAHGAWAARLVADLGASLGQELAVELGIEGHGQFRSLWRPHSLEGESEQILVPTRCSAALSRFLSALNLRAAASIVSIDAIQVPPPTTHSQILGVVEGQNPGQQQRQSLSSLVLAQLHVAAVECAASHYSTTLSSRDADLASPSASASAGPGGVNSSGAASSISSNSTGRRAARRLQLERLSEDCALQAALDLAVLEAVAGRCGLSLTRPLRAAQQGWQARMDPINAQLLSSVLQHNARVYAQRCFLLFPGSSSRMGVSAPAPAAVVAAAAQLSEEEVIAGIFAGQGQGQGQGIGMQPCRFSLLPLAFSTTHAGGASLSKTSHGDSGDSSSDRSLSSRDRDGVRGAHGQAGKKGGKVETASTAGGLGKTLITSLGSILGGASSQ